MNKNFNLPESKAIEQTHKTLLNDIKLMRLFFAFSAILFNELIQGIGKHKAKSDNISTLVFLIRRILADYRSMYFLINMGYAEQASVIGTSFFEHCLMIQHIGSDEEKCKSFLQHEHHFRPVWPVSRMIEDLYQDDKGKKQRYKNIYKEFCKIKHGNPLAMKGLWKKQILDKRVYTLPGPDLRKDSKWDKIGIITMFSEVLLDTYSVILKLFEPYINNVKRVRVNENRFRKLLDKYSKSTLNRIDEMLSQLGITT